MQNNDEIVCCFQMWKSCCSFLPSIFEFSFRDYGFTLEATLQHLKPASTDQWILRIMLQQVFRRGCVDLSYSQYAFSFASAARRANFLISSALNLKVSDDAIAGGSCMETYNGDPKSAVLVLVSK